MVPPQNDLPKTLSTAWWVINSQIKPYMVYDDGINTYFTFESSILPDIFEVRLDGSEVFAEYKIFENEVVVKYNITIFT